MWMFPWKILFFSFYIVFDTYFIESFFCFFFNAMELYRAESLFCYFYIACGLHLKESSYCCFSVSCVFHVAKSCFLFVKYCMLLTRCSLKDSYSAVFKLHMAGTMQNIRLAPFTLHVAHNLDSFIYYFQIICGFTFAFSKLHVAHILQNFVFVVLFIECGLHMKESCFCWFFVTIGSYISESIFYHF